MAQVILLDAATRHSVPPAPLFDSHFPGAPRVPGSCLVEAVRRDLEAALPRWRVHELLGARFRRFLMPGDALEFRLFAATGDALAQRAEARCQILRQGVRCVDLRFGLARRAEGEVILPLPR